MTKYFVAYILIECQIRTFKRAEIISSAFKRSLNSNIFWLLLLGENCTDHNKNHGICKKISECDNLNLVYELYKLQRDYPRHRLLEADVKNCNSTNSRNELVVCCMEGEIQSKSINFPVGKACVTPNSATTKYQNQPGVCSRKFSNIRLHFKHFLSVLKVERKRFNLETYFLQNLENFFNKILF